MAFFRTKKIKGNEYAYRVDNSWKKGTSKQIVKEYLGRAFRFSLVNDVEFSQFLELKNLDDYLDKSDPNKIMYDLIEWELHRFNVGNDFDIDVRKMEINKKRKNVTLIINEGFMCSFTLKNLFGFKSESNAEHDGYRLARAFVEAGIKVPHKIFAEIFGKLYKAPATLDQ